MKITTSNMKSLLQIAENLQIDSVLDAITNFNDKFDAILQEAEVVDEIFDNLLNIDKISVENVKKSILESIYIQSEENIEELVAIILQIIGQSRNIHSKIIKLLLSLNESANNENELKLLLPFFIKKLKSIFYISTFNLIPISDILEEILNIDPYFPSEMATNRKSRHNFNDSCHRNIVFVFAPELIEMKKVPLNYIINCMNSTDMNLLSSYFPTEIEKFKQMRNSEEPEDEITKAIIHDDVDKLQSIVSTRSNLINRGRIPSSIFDPFCNCISKSYVDFACQCGSVRCFKYLLLNHADFDTYTFGFAIYGNNTEIIHIVKQNMNSDRRVNLSRANNNNWNNMLSDPINLAISCHLNGILDWLFEKKVSNNENRKENLLDYADNALGHVKMLKFHTID